MKNNHRREEVKRTRRHLSSLRGEGARKGVAQNEGKGGKIGNSESKVRQPQTTTAYATNRHTTEPPEHLDQMENGPK